MIQLHGPTYRYAGETLGVPEIICVSDHHYNENNHSFELEKLLIHSRCDPKQHVIIFDHVMRHDDRLKNYDLIGFPSFLARENTEFIDQQIQTDWNNKKVIFNFMINKPRPHRIQLLKLIQQFDLQDYQHSLAWQTNPVNSVAVTNYCIGTETIMSQGVKNGSSKNALIYQALLQKNIFEPSCVSLITEPAFFEQETIITEKTLMALWAGTIPIWVGGWGCANWLQQHGFDIFDDIVDHNYQWLADPEDRVYRAVADNLDLLRNFDMVNQFVVSHQSRFEHNRILLESNYFYNECLRMINQHTGPIKLQMQQMLGLTQYK
jgi:hypothetical protein